MMESQPGILPSSLDLQEGRSSDQPHQGKGTGAYDLLLCCLLAP